ncbi:MAG: UvrD-helicase domain-containing protein [Candidatus Marinimicrobia bacterium]|nr:UvrD-helicase domain-containing protein [Candidatus Neomarinimicrobiota bacterium]
MTDILSGLNARQREAVLTTDGPVLIFAGAGSGKTRVLTRRIAWLLKQKKTTGNRILAVTFTNKAANEMKERVTRLLGQVNYVNIGTFHSIGARILRGEKPLPESPRFYHLRYGRYKKVISQCLKATGTDPKELPPSQVMHYISGQKQQLRKPEAAEKAAKGRYMQEKMAFIYREYDREMQKNNACDFDDLLMRPLLMFDKYPAIAEKYRHRWDYILVDEYQDTNTAQFRLVRLFSEKHGNICVVGDDDQSIYGWRGADIRNILEFENTFPGAKTIKLEQNYRSTKTIIEAASRMIGANDHRADEHLWTEGEQGERILHKECERDFEEADYIANRILRSGQPLRDYAVLYRTNAQSRLLEKALHNRGIRYVLVGGVKFYERREIKDILAYLNVLVNPRDTVNLKRIVNVPARNIGEKSLGRLEQFAAETRRTLWEAFQYPEEAGLHARARQALRGFMDIMVSLNGKMRELPPADFAVEVLEKSGLHAMYQDKEDPVTPGPPAQPGRVYQ